MIAPPKAALALAACLALTTAARAEPAPDAPYRNAISVALPSIDGLRGAQVSYERWCPCRRLSLAVSGQLRQTATVDFGGLTAGLGAELRWYWRARAWLTHQHRGSMVGWFVGGRVDLAADWIRDRVEDRALGTGLAFGVATRVGYRIAPWRGLEITPLTGLSWRHQIDLDGRVPSQSAFSVVFGMSLGWMF